MEAGRLRHLITIQRPGVATQADDGQEIPGTPTESTAWARVEAQLTSGEIWNEAQVQAAATHTITVRGAAAITEECRIVWQGRRFEVVSAVDPDGLGREQRVLAIERK